MVPPSIPGLNSPSWEAAQAHSPACCHPLGFHSNSSFLNTAIKQLDGADKAAGPAPRNGPQGRCPLMAT